MKLPRFNLRDLFWLVLVLALLLGWLRTWDLLRVDYNSHLNKVMSLRYREHNLREHFLAEGYFAEWDESKRAYKLTKVQTLSQEERNRRMLQSGSTTFRCKSGHASSVL